MVVGESGADAGGGGAGTYLTPSGVANKLQMLYPEIAGFDWVFVGDLDDDYSDEIFFYELLSAIPSPNAEDAGHASWFVAGGEFSGTTLSANGSLTMTMPGNNASALDWLLAA